MKCDSWGRRLAAATRGVLTLLITLTLSACVSVIGGTGATGAEERESPAEVQEPTREYLLDTPEDTVVDTPWVTVSSVILRVQWTQPETVVVVPADSRMRRYLGLSPMIDTQTTIIPGNRFLFNLGVMTDGVPPFAPEPDRYRYPHLYE